MEGRGGWRAQQKGDEEGKKSTTWKTKEEGDLMRLMFKEGYKEVSKEREMENREEEERKRNRKMGMNGKNLKE